MPKITYKTQSFHAGTLAIVNQANAIIAEYARQGFDLTLRQLYYQFVARDIIKNTMKEYKRLGSIINDARLGGLIDWDSITDRTRNLRWNSHWDSPQDVLRGAARGYRIDKWFFQPYRPEVWIEKDALVGVLEAVCPDLDVPFFSCRGYTSQSEMWRAAMRLKLWKDNGQTPIILHLGDHDPSGCDMTRDIEERLDMFIGTVEVKRLALTMDQVEEYHPPPNPAKMTDSRVQEYLDLYGDESWELDALDPPTITALITDAVMDIRDEEEWAKSKKREDTERAQLSAVSANWPKIKNLPYIKRTRKKEGD